MRLSVFELSERRNILVGTAMGRRLLSRLIDGTRVTNDSEIVFLDFTEVDVATSSFLRESLIGYRDFARRSTGSIYPVLANLSSSVLEELEFFVRRRGEVFWCCDLYDQEIWMNARLVGQLEAVQQATFEAVVRMGVATAGKLAKRDSESGLRTTAWNNRLAVLAAKGVLVESRKGSTKVYRPVLEIN